MDAFDDDDDDDAVLSLQFLMVLSTIISAGIAQYGARQCPFESRWTGTKAAIIHNGKRSH